MVTAARDRLARTLGGEVKSASSVETTAALDDLSLHVEGIGRIKFPLTPARVRKLIEFGQPARFGRGAETLTDPDVRDTWEIPKRLVSAVWDDAALADVLATVKDELGLPLRAELTADLHSFLVYEPGQFFLAHQDSEKDDSMFGTLVVTLPSSYAGGELLVERDGESMAYRGTRAAHSIVAFFADCRAEGDAGTITELAGLLREHFATPVPRYYHGPATDTPNRLVYLLDHEYTPRALNGGRLKGADADRVSLLRAAADDAGCETILALADIRTQHGASAYDPYEYPSRRWRDDYGDGYDNDHAADREPEGIQIHGLIDSEVTLTHWTGPAGTGLEETSLLVAAGDVCASTPTDYLQPLDSQYEGYMGNYGNTLDRWYHRAAVVVWPRALAFANRAEPTPVQALEQLAAMAAAGDAPGAGAAAMTLAPFWDATVRSRLTADNGGTSELFDRALRAGRAVADEASAMMLLRPFRLEDLTAATVSPFAEVIGHHDTRWTVELLEAWFAGNQRAWPYGGWERAHWVAGCLQGVCEGLHAVGGAGPVAAQRLVDLAWEWAEHAIRPVPGVTSPSRRDQQLTELGEPLAALLSAAAAIGAASTMNRISSYVRKQDDSVIALEMSALRAAALLPSGKTAPPHTGLGALADNCAARLRSRLDRPFRAHDDWSIELPAGGCACALCGDLREFLAGPGRRTFERRFAEQFRQHVLARIDGLELPITHTTKKQGRPYTLVLTKTDALFTADLQQRSSAAADLDWLAAEWPSAT